MYKNLGKLKVQIENYDELISQYEKSSINLSENHKLMLETKLSNLAREIIAGIDDIKIWRYLYRHISPETFSAWMDNNYPGRKSDQNLLDIFIAELIVGMK